MLSKKGGFRRIAALMIVVLTGASMASFAFSKTVWHFSDGSIKKIINITTSPGSNSDAKITVPIGAEVTNIKLKVKQKVFSTRFIWIPLSY